MSDQPTAYELIPLNRYADLPKGVQLHEGTEAGYRKKYNAAPRKAYQVKNHLYFVTPEDPSCPSVQSVTAS